MYGRTVAGHEAGLRIPAGMSSPTTDLDLVTGLRRAVHGRSVRGSIHLSHDHHHSDFPRSYVRSLLSTRRQTLLCAGASYWLYHVYRDIGLDAFVLNTGSPQDPSHAMTFVKVHHNGRDVWSLQDAYLNMTYVDADGQLLCLTDVYRLLRCGQFQSIHPSVSPGHAPVLLDRLDEDPGRFKVVKRIAAAQGLDLQARPEGIQYLEWNYDSYPFDEEPSFRDLVRERFGSESLALLLALPLGSSGEPYAVDFENQAASVRDALRVGRASSNMVSREFSITRIPLDNAYVHGGRICMNSPLTVESSPAQWAYAISVPLTSGDNATDGVQLPMSVSITAHVETGELECLLVADDWDTLLGSVPPAVGPGRHHVNLPWERGAGAAHLVFRNHTPGGRPCVFTVDSVELSPPPSEAPPATSRLDEVLSDDLQHIDIAKLRRASMRQMPAAQLEPQVLDPLRQAGEGTSAGPSARRKTPEQFVDIVSVDAVHQRLGFSCPLDYPLESRRKPLAKRKMEVDDAPILRYVYRQFRPRRHLEFGTWEGMGACCCLEECNAGVWTLNLLHGEIIDGRPAYSSTPSVVPRGATPLRRQNNVDVYQTDAGAFIGHRYRTAGLGHRVCQIFCDSRDWDTSPYPEDFFDSALIDGGHAPDVVASDTRKALSVVRPGGLVLWHDFCPDPALFADRQAVAGVVGGLTRDWDELSRELRDAFWIRPSFLLVAVR